MYALKGKSETGLMARVASGFARVTRRIRVSPFLDEYVRVPRHLGSLAVLFFLGAVAVFGMVRGGYTPDVLRAVASSAGFSIEKVDIRGNSRTSDIDVLAALGLDGDAALASLDVAAAQAEIAALPWVKSVSVRKIYPDRLTIAVVEREPFAVWQHNGRMDIIDRDGRIITARRAGAENHLPLVVGDGAGQAAAVFFAEMAAFPEMRERVQAYIRVGGRRWDLLLDNGVRVKLPARDVGRGLKAALSAGDGMELFARDVQSVDLRLEDRITVALSDEAMARRAEQEERQRRLRKAGRI
ncbi:MAG: Cell division protein FtsQ [Candidatus Tokpelaia hoelldobleri]|uniref:Cell division protein FtsQ n=1 Tax=Candidatus Tokpelaia hoelldobleri TaxID=1902579 RepID=A0A1U9JVY5_9HYPH|nr:MAG: Cell division protein FtsQ [Candidatus Tokpelaia hoelldoblerii]